MIKRVSITNRNNETLDLILPNPELSGIILYAVSGLGPPGATINTTTLTSGDGTIYNSARMNERNIVLYMQLLWQPEIETMRHLTYKYFHLKSRVKVEVETESRTVFIYGYVESNEHPIFSSTQNIQVSIICPDPYFRSSREYDTPSIEASESYFYFPFANDNSATPGEGVIVFSQINEDLVSELYYEGDATTGAVFELHAYGDVTNPKIYNYETSESITIRTDVMSTLTGSGMKAGDSIFISTVQGDKYVKLLRDGIETNILNAISKDTVWLQINGGSNMFGYTADSGVADLQLSIKCDVLYEGI